MDKPGLFFDEYCPCLVADFHSQLFRTFDSIATSVVAACFIGEDIPIEGCLKGTFRPIFWICFYVRIEV